MLMRFAISGAALLLAACQQEAPADLGSSEFLSNLQPYCGNAYAGRVVSDDPEDAAWASQAIIADFDYCTEAAARIPLHVGEDHSRMWLLALGDDGRMALRHRHTHADGSPDAVTMYGGKSSDASTVTRQEFPADDRTKALFDAEGIPVSKANVWAMEIHPDQDMLAYELKRPERFFRVEFDLSQPVEAPADPW
ncbi:hypothetical protein D1224_08610 [Henriciella barbarensis]|uniref:Uncharacterized protein n=1 Tax=Henriciella barbarensis TaxID=86342 RepID=A0A399R340_9PROT|nr:hypothetical protein [Henriciella barbarensis]RIJ24287.1 hypothetical protein D1224_08610 [Henriciella barbarensis]